MKPIFIDWAITNKCNLRCIHCTGMMENELSCERALTLIDEIKELNPEWIIIEGGEPFLRKDIFKILERVNIHNLKTYIITNALLLNKEIIKNIKEMENLKILVSFDGSNKGTYESIKIGARWETFIKNADLLKDAGILHGFTVVLSKKNKKEIEGFVEWGKKFKVKVIIFIPLEPFEPLDDYYKLSLSPKEYIEVMERIIKISGESEIKLFFDEPFFNVYLSLKKIKWKEGTESGIIANKKGCIAGEYIYIQTNGDVRPCMFADKGWTIGNILNTSLEKIWEKMKGDEELLFARRRDKRKGECANCKFFESCFGCLARIKRVKGSIFESDFLCPIPYLNKD